MTRFFPAGCLFLLSGAANAVPADMELGHEFAFPRYTQEVHLEFATEAAARRAEVRPCPLFDGHARAVSCRWDDNIDQDLEVRKRLDARGMRATWYLNGNAVGYLNGRDFRPTARRLLADGNSIGGHGLSHPYLSYCHPNRAFEETCGVRIEWEAALDTCVSSYAFSFVDYRNPLEGDARQRDIIRTLERAGLYHLSVFKEFADRVPSGLQISLILPPENAPFEEFVRACDWAFGSADLARDYPGVAHSMHGWYGTPLLHYGFDELERRLDHVLDRGEHWLCNQNEFAAYRYQVRHTDLSCEHRGERLTVRLQRPLVRFLNDRVPLSLEIGGGLGREDLVAATCTSADLVASSRPVVDGFRFTLHHDRDQGLPARVDVVGSPADPDRVSVVGAAAEFPGLEAGLRHESDRLVLELVNDGPERLIDGTVTFRLPIGWEPGVSVVPIPDLAAGGHWRTTLPLRAVADRDEARVGRAFAVAQLDFRRGGAWGRLYVTCHSDAPVPASCPRDAFLCMGPFVPAVFDPEAFAAHMTSRDPGADGGWDAAPGGPAVWRDHRSDGPVDQEHLDLNVIRTGGDWYRGNSDVYVLRTRLVATHAGQVKLHCHHEDLRQVWLDGVQHVDSRVPLSVTVGPHDLVLVVHCAAGPGTPRHTAFYLKLIDSETGERCSSIDFQRPGTGADTD